MYKQVVQQISLTLTPVCRYCVKGPLRAFFCGWGFGFEGVINAGEKSMWNSLWLAVGLLFIFEGIGPLLFPNRWAAFVQEMVAQGPVTLRRVGGVLVVIGAVVVVNFL
ncbi:MAG: hypothetical protein ACI8WB_000401 [Phenylobacterium sp.]